MVNFSKLTSFNETRILSNQFCSQGGSPQDFSRTKLFSFESSKMASRRAGKLSKTWDVKDYLFVLIKCHHVFNLPFCHIIISNLSCFHYRAWTKKSDKIYVIETVCLQPTFSLVVSGIKDLNFSYFTTQLLVHLWCHSFFNFINTVLLNLLLCEIFFYESFKVSNFCKLLYSRPVLRIYYVVNINHQRADSF